MTRKSVTSGLLALLALAVASAIAFASSSRSHPQLTVASISAPSGPVRAGDSIRLRVTLVDTGATPVHHAAVSYRVLRRAGRRMSVVWLGEDALGRLRPRRPAGYSTKLRFPRALSVGTYRLIACVWPGGARKRTPRGAACRTSGKFKLDAAAKPLPTPQPASSPGPNPPTPVPTPPPAAQDVTPPALDLTVTPAAPDGSNGYYSHRPAVHASADDQDLTHVTCSDNGSTALDLSGGGTHLGGAVPTSGDGAHHVSCTATDRAGNSATRSATFTVDSALPAVGLTDPANDSFSKSATPALDGPAGTASGDDNSVDVSIYSGAAASGSPVQTLTAAVSSGKWHTSPSSALADGTYTALASQSNVAGNSAHSDPHSFTVDTTAPTAAVTLTPSSPDGTNGWYKSQPAVHASASDANLASLSCSVDGGTAENEPVSGTSASGSPTVSGDGPHTVSCTATDKAGNAKSASQTFKVDATAPTAAVTLSPGSPDGSSGWYKSMPSVQASASDTNLASLSCAVDGGSAENEPVSGTSASGSPTVSGDGSHTVSCTAMDAAGNSTPASQTFKVDSTAPKVTFTDPNPGATTDDQTPTFGGSAGTASGDSSTVSIAVYKGTTTTGSPVETLTATSSGGNWSVASPRLDYGTYTAVASQADQAGNVGTSQLNIDVPAVLDAAGDIASCNEPNSNPSSWSVASGGSTATLLGTTNPDVIAPLGDNAYENGTLNEFNRCYGPTWGQSPFFGITRPAPGNHEYQTPNAAGYFQYFNNDLSSLGSAATDSTKGWYSYDLGHWHVIVLNTSDGCGTVSCAAGSAQEQWLKADLAAHPNVCTVAYWHHPLYTSDNEAGVPPLTAVKPLWQDLYNAHVDLVLNGHAHLYERFKPQDANGSATSAGITEITAGTGGYSEHTYSTPAANSVALADTYGVLELWLGAKSYRFQFVPAAGQTFTDFGSGNCHETG